MLWYIEYVYSIIRYFVISSDYELRNDFSQVITFKFQFNDKNMVFIDLCQVQLPLKNWTRKRQTSNKQLKVNCEEIMRNT